MASTSENNNQKSSPSSTSSTSPTAVAKRAAIDKDKAARRAAKRLAQQQALQQAQQQHQQLITQASNNGIKIKHEEQILEAIDQLRRRKARPDADRICNYLLRKYAVDARDTIADLHRLIESEKVIQVDYKGNTSYRNASKWTRLQLYKNRPEGFVKEKINASMVSGAVAELVIEEPDWLDQGVPPVRLVEQLLDGVSNPTSRRMVEDFLSKEVASGNLARLSNGNYSLVDCSNMSTSPQHQHNGDIKGPRSSISSSGTATSTPIKEQPINNNNAYDIDEDSSSYTIKSSRQTSPKMELVETMKKEDCYEIIIGGRQYEEEVKPKECNGKVENGIQKEDSIKQNGKSHSSVSEVKEETKTVAAEPPVNQKKSKTERKQRLCVRSDDATDILFKYEDTWKDDFKEEPDKKDDGNDRLSEDGENDHDAGRSSTNPSPTPSHNNAVNFRSARRKRAKKVFDPSDNMVVKRKRGRPAAANSAKALAALAAAQQEAQESIKPVVKEPPKDPNRSCSLCNKDKQEVLTACRDCTVRAHPSCIYSPEEMNIKLCTSWQCERCKTCVICFETSEAGPLITCYSCDDAYHYACHSPRVSTSRRRWYCNECNYKKPEKPRESTQNSNSNWTNNSVDNHSNASAPGPVSSPQVSPSRPFSENMDDDASRDAMDPNIPDASDWTSEQVYQYFSRLFPKEAEIFRNQEIDGHSLLLLKRSDVLGGLDLLLGPALKIYRHVLKLQVRRDDPRLYWL